MLNKIRNIFKDQDLEKEVERLKMGLIEREFLYNELSKTNIITLQKNKQLEKILIEEKKRNENLKNEYTKKIIAEMDQVKKLKNEKLEFEKEISVLKAEFPRLEVSYLKELEKKESLLKELEDLKFIQKEHKKDKENLENKLKDLKEGLRVEKINNKNLKTDKESTIKDYENSLSHYEDLLKDEKSKCIKLSEELIELKEVVELKNLKEKDLEEFRASYFKELEKKESLLKELESLRFIQKEYNKDKESLENKLKDLEEGLRLEKINNKNLKTDKESTIKDYENSLSHYEDLLKDEKSKCIKLSEELIELKEVKNLKEKDLEEFRASYLKELEKKESLLKELESLKFIQKEYNKDKENLENKLKDLEEGLKLEKINNKNLKTDKESTIKDYENSLNHYENLLKDEKSKCIKLSEELIELKEVKNLKEKDLEEFRASYLKELEKKESLLKELESLKFIQKEHNKDKESLENKLKDLEDRLRLEKNKRDKLSKELSELSEKLEKNKILKNLEIQKNEIVIFDKQEEKLIPKEIETIKKETIENNHAELKVKEIKNSWADKDKFLEYKDNLTELLKTFNGNDFKEMYLEGKKRGVLKSLKDRDFSNIITRLKLKLPLTTISLEKIEGFYEGLMNDIYSQEFSLIKENIETTKENEKEINVEDENKFEREEFDIESYTAKDWYRFYQIAQEFKVKDYLQKAIFTLWKYEERDLMISDSQYATIRRNYSELYEVIKKFESEKCGIRKNYLKNIDEDKENTLHEKPEKNIEKIVEDDYSWKNYEVYSLNKSDLIPVILRFSLLDFKEMLSIGSERGILNEMEKRQMANIITWVKLSTPLARLNLKKVQEIYIKLMQELFQKKSENEIAIYDDILPVNDKRESEIQEKSEENIIKKFNDILEIGLKEGVVNIKDLQEINFDNEDDIYDIYEAIEILEERGIRINY